MINVEKIDDVLFDIYVKDVNAIIDMKDKNTDYFIIDIDEDNIKLKLGLKAYAKGLLPKVEITNNIAIKLDDLIYICDKSGKTLIISKMVEKYIYEDKRNILHKVVGHYDFHNSYYIVDIFLKNNYYKLGIEQWTNQRYFDLKVVNDNLLIIAGSKFIVIDENKKIIFKCELIPDIYEIKIYQDKILLCYELGFVCLNYKYEVLWKKEMEDILEEYFIIGETIKVKIYDTKYKYLTIDINNGKIIKGKNKK